MRRTLVLSFSLLWLVAATHASAQVQDTGRQKCASIADLNADLVAFAQAGEITRCFGDGARGLLGDPAAAEACFNADAKGKVARKELVAITKELKSCSPGALPDFAVPVLGGPYTAPASAKEYDPLLDEMYAEATSASATKAENTLIVDLFGNPVGDAMLLSSDDAAGAKCQLEVTKAVQRCERAKRQTYNKCEKASLKSGVASASVLETTCLTTAGDPATGQPDPKGQLAKKCAAKIAWVLEKKCSSQDLGALFPGACATAGVAGFPGCAVQRIDCRLCQQLNEFNGLARDCDLLDDGAANGSCRDTLPVCGDDILDLPSEQCDDGNTANGDCCSSTCQFETTAAACAQPRVVIQTPDNGVFSLAASATVTGHVENINLNNATLEINGTPVALEPDKTFSTTVPLSRALVFNPVLATLTRLNDGQKSHDRMVVIAGESITKGDLSPDGIGLRVNDSGLDEIEPAVESLVNIDPASLIPPGTRVISNYCYADTFLGCLGSVNVSISGSPPPSISGFNINMDSKTGFVAADITLHDLFVRANVDDASGVPLHCTMDITSSSVQIFGDYALSPLAAQPTEVDVTQVGPVSVVLGGFSSSTSCSGALGGVVEALLGLFIGDVQGLFQPALENFLNTTDANGNTPIAGAIETALTGIDIAGPVGGGLGVVLQTPFTAIDEDEDGITFKVDASAVASAPDPDAPNLTASYHVDEAFPTFGPTTPVGGVPYGLGISISTSAFNQLLRAQIESGLLREELTSIDLGGGPIPLTAGLLTAFFPQLSVIPPATPLAVRLAPTIAPVLTGNPGPMGELAELKIAQLVAEVVANPNSSDESVLATIAVDARLGFQMAFGTGGIALTITPPGPADLTIALLGNPLGIDEAAVQSLLPAILGPLLPTLADALGNLPLPEFFGLDLQGVDVSRIGQHMGIFANLVQTP
jgi:cysteine-rich repeat protein